MDTDTGKACVGSRYVDDWDVWYNDSAKQNPNRLGRFAAALRRIIPETHRLPGKCRCAALPGLRMLYNDPREAFPFLNRLFSGCHDLIRLGEYDLAGKILETACQLEFQVVEAEDSEDSAQDSLFTIADACKEGMLSMSAWKIGHDWIEALLLGKKIMRMPDLLKGWCIFYSLSYAKRFSSAALKALFRKSFWDSWKRYWRGRRNRSAQN